MKFSNLLISFIFVLTLISFSQASPYSNNLGVNCNDSTASKFILYSEFPFNIYGFNYGGFFYYDSIISNYNFNSNAKFRCRYIFSDGSFRDSDYFQLNNLNYFIIKDLYLTPAYPEVSDEIICTAKVLSSSGTLNYNLSLYVNDLLVKSNKFDSNEDIASISEDLSSFKKGDEIKCRLNVSSTSESKIKEVKTNIYNSRPKLILGSFILRYYDEN